MPGVFAVTMNLVVFVQDGVRVTVVHRLAVGVGICVMFVAGMIRVVGVVAVFVAHGNDGTPRGYGCQGVSTIERFKADLDAYITHWNTTRRQVKLKGLTPAEYRDQALQEAA